MIVLGIDIGVSGAIAVLKPALVEVHDMPVLKDGPAGRRAINAPLLSSIIFASHADWAFVEYVGARPGEGAVGAFSFGRARGVIEGVLAAAGVPCTFLTPPSWKRAIGLPAGRDKDASRGEAIRRWPNHAALFARKCDDGRAEACLIAVAGIMKS
jgi:crossover junction endodeoxyribonuclease RuvC